MELGKVKSQIERYSKENGIDVQVAWDSFFFNEFLYRISLSKFKYNYVFKGGFYLQTILGVGTRSTMDLDFKYSGANMADHELIKEVEEICALNQESNISFSYSGIEDIKAEMKYGGKSIRIEARFFNIRKRFSIDIATGDSVTPEPVEYNFSNPFRNECFEIMAYSIESMISEKFETLVSKGVNNSRSKDLLDLYLLKGRGYDKTILNVALINTFFHRGTPLDKYHVKSSLEKVFSFFRIRELYENYSRKNKFASNISFEMCQEAVRSIFSDITYHEPIPVKDYGVEIHLVRHGEEENDKLGGWSDSHLTDRGKAQIHNLVSELDRDYDLLISSDLVRAEESAMIIGKALEKDFVFDAAFRETNNGVLRNLSIKEFKERYPGMFFSSLRMDECYPDGESPISFYHRVSQAFLKLLDENRNKKILLVTHGGVITVILCCVHGLDYSNLLKIVPPAGSVTKVI